MFERFRKLLLLAAVAGAAFRVPCANAQDLSLETCVREALKRNPGVRAAACRAEAARARIDETRSAFYPHVLLSGGYARTDNPPQAFMMSLNQRVLRMTDPGFDPNAPEDTENVRLSASARYRLFDGRRRLQLSMAYLGESAAREQLAAARNELAHQVTRGYYGLLQVQAFVEVGEESVKSLEESLRVSRERFAAGSAVKTDVLNIEVELAQAREDVIRSRNGVQLAVAALNTAIGAERVPEAGLPKPSERVLEPDEPEGGLLSIEDRPELRAVQSMERVKGQKHKKALREYLPTVNAFGSLDRDSDTFADFEDSYMVGVMLEWEAFSGFRRPAAAAAARAEWQAAVQDVQKVRNELRLDLRQAEIDRREAHERLAVTRKSVESAEEALRMTLDRYQQGAADITELLVAETRLAAIRTRDVAAYYDSLIARSNLERASGALVRKFEREE